MKILIVDDDPICLTSIETVLKEDYNCHVDTAMTPDKALEIIYNLAMDWEPDWYDFILMDIQLPTMKGDLLTKVIRQAEENMRHTPVIAITSHATDEEITKFKSLGITDILFKPITKEQIDGLIKQYVKQVN